MYPERIRSRWWYLAPIFIGLIGGIIAYFAIRRDDPQKAKAIVDEMCKKLLANLVIEDYKIIGSQ